jgi:AraC-like DNA-binding protein
MVKGDGTESARAKRTGNGPEFVFLVFPYDHCDFQDMDILSDLLREAGLRRRVLDVHEVRDTDVLRFPCERSVGFHVVLEGTLYVHTDGEAAPLMLEAGDVAVMGRGCLHRLAARADVRGLPVAELSARRGMADAAPAWPGSVRVVSGAYQLWNAPLHPFFAEWPAWHVVRGSRTASLAPVPLCVNLLMREMAEEAMGRDTVVHALLDVIFTQLLRDMSDRRAAQGASFSQAVHDPQLLRVVQCMHEDCARDWTLDTLAREAGLSRTVLAERFRMAMHDTPLSYLRTVRLQRAMRLLVESTDTLERIATAVGYRDAFAFSKAFKRSVGQSPGEYRRQRAAEERAGLRFPISDVMG